MVGALSGPGLSARVLGQSSQCCPPPPPAGCVRVVRGEGMPQYRNPFEKGDLYIKFDVQFPENNWINPDKLSVSVPRV